MKKLIFSLVLVLYLVSCSEDNQIKSNRNYTAEFKRRDMLKEKFGRMLGNAIVDHPSLRLAIKTEALKMFDNDYDVLYHDIKNMTLSDGLKFRDVLLNYFEDEKYLIEIENEVPLLTIFVPELPGNTFSAKLWNTQEVIPSIGITYFDTNDVLIVNSTEEFIIKADLIPNFPALVIKENERIVKKDGSLNSLARGRVFMTADNLEFQFLADCFDGSLSKQLPSARLANDLDPVVINAWWEYDGWTATVDGWHRDYIYYGISPSNTSGPFNYDFQEHIRSFKFINDPNLAYSLVSDQRGTSNSLLDPSFKSASLTYPSNSGWTEGGFEFEVRMLYNAKNGLGAEFQTFFGAMPQELFTVVYLRQGLLYYPTITSLPQKNLVLPLFSWDLKDYASSIKIEIDEYDRAETVVTSDTRTVKFAANFNVDLKIGLKFGSTAETTQTQTIQKTYTVGNDPLGPVIVNFGDDVIVDILNNRTREYTTGYYSISVEPKRVQ